MRKSAFAIIISLVLSMLIYLSAHAQDEDGLNLRLNRDFGYGGMGNDIQGLFSLEIRNPPANLKRVEFTIDGGLLAEDGEPPFKIQFSTDSYPIGEHDLAAIGYTSDNQILHSQTYTMDFVRAPSKYLALSWG